MKMKFQILDFKFWISKSGQKMNSPLEIRNSKFSSAFTLIEIMVAIAIFALLVAAVYSTWMVILKSIQVGDAAGARAQRERIAIRTLEDSLTCIQSFQASMGYYTFNVTNGDQPGLSFVARLPDIFPRNGKFDANLRRLTFSVEAGADSERDLVLRQNPILMDQDADEQQIPLVLAKNVKDFIVESWDTNALDWVDEWDSTNSLPPMVRVTLTLALDNKNDQYNSAAPVLAITREIAMPSSTLPAIAQTGSPIGGGAGVGNIGGAGGNGNGNRNGQNGNGNGNNRGNGGFGNGGGFGGNQGGNRQGGFGN
jgi:type II secretion system protein J